MATAGSNLMAIVFFLYHGNHGVETSLTFWARPAAKLALAIPRLDRSSSCPHEKVHESKTVG